MVPLLLAATRVRGSVVLAFAGLAIALLVLQMLIGFPLANAAAETNAEIKKAGGNGKKDDDGDGTLWQQLGEMMAMKSSYLD